MAAMAQLRETKAQLRAAIRQDIQAQITVEEERRSSAKLVVTTATKTIKNLKKKQTRLLSAVTGYSSEVAHVAELASGPARINVPGAAGEADAARINVPGVGGEADAARINVPRVAGEADHNNAAPAAMEGGEADADADADAAPVAAAHDNAAPAAMEGGEADMEE